MAVVLQEFQRKSQAVAAQLLRGLAIGLGLPEEYFQGVRTYACLCHYHDHRMICRLGQTPLPFISGLTHLVNRAATLGYYAAHAWCKHEMTPIHGPLEGSSRTKA